MVDRNASFHEGIHEDASVADMVPDEASFFSGANETYLSGDESVPDIMLLNVFCARAKAPKESEASQVEAEQSWQPVREWLSSHNAEEVRAAAEYRGESGLTALHFACRHVPPLDVIDVFLSIALDTVQWPDSFGWLPIHYASASGSDCEVIKALAEAYPESKTTVDRRGRTPLHFALGDKPASPDIIFLLSSSGAPSYPDEIGMLVSSS
jgi:Ankyrin repeats (3 copies)